MDKHHQQSSHHITPLPVYYKTLGALLVLTVVTVGASYINFGKANIFVAMAIASSKASLVLMFFMGLKYDNAVNRAVILSSFVALFLFIFFAAADSWTRTFPAPVKAKAAGVALSLDELKKLSVATESQVGKGRELYAINCSVCHGIDGRGDGAGGAALNPKPRNFHTAAAEWKFGNSPEGIYTTLAYGIAGGAMAAYKSMSASDRWALSHFVATFGTGEKILKVKDKYEQALKEDSAAVGSGGAGKTIPVDFAIQQMLKDEK